MYPILFFLTLAIFTTPSAKSLDSEAKTIDYKNDKDSLGNYFFRFETSNGIVREETGRLINDGLPDEHVAVKGFYSYIDENGIIQTTNYSADTDGYVIIPQIPQESVAAAPVPGSVIASLLGR